MYTTKNDNISIGTFAGYQYQDSYCIAIGYNAAYKHQGFAYFRIGTTGSSIAIGNGAGYYWQGGNSIAIGKNAGRRQRTDCIGIGEEACCGDFNTDVNQRTGDGAYRQIGIGYKAVAPQREIIV